MKTEILNKAGNPILNLNCDVDPFTLAYIECALWSSNDNSNEQGGEPFDKNYNWTDLAPETTKRMVDDCAKFQAENSKLLCVSQSNAREAGHCFWLSQNGHGSGFFDSEHFANDTRDQLQAKAQAYGTLDLYLGDDGKIYGS